MFRGKLFRTLNWPSNPRVLCLLVLGLTYSLIGMAAPQTGSDIPPDAIPQIDQISPNQAVAGMNLMVTIHGSHFSAGAYVSSVSPVVQVESSKRFSDTQIEAHLVISASAQPSRVSLLVSNPASRAAEAAFQIVAPPAIPAPAPRPPEVATPQPAPPPPAEPPAQPPPPPAAQPKPTPPAIPAPAPATVPLGPAVAVIEPARVSQGLDVDLKITGQRFAQGSKVSFANPGIRVIGVTSNSSTALTVHIKVASDAAPGNTSMYVINPDDREVEAPFAVTAKRATITSTSAQVPAGAERYEAFHLGNPAEIFQVHGKVKGTLVVSAGTIQYQEDGKTLVNISLSDIKEIKVSSVAPNTFHITLTSGKTFHFAPGSARPSDARNIVDALHKDLPQPKP